MIIRLYPAYDKSTHTRYASISMENMPRSDNICREREVGMPCGRCEDVWVRQELRDILIIESADTNNKINK